MNKKFVTTLSTVAAFGYAWCIAKSIKIDMDTKRRARDEFIVEATIEHLRLKRARAIAERKQKMDEQEDYDIKFDLIMNIDFN